MLKKLYRNIFKKKFDNMVGNVFHQLMNRKYVSGFPKLRNSVFASLSPIWISHHIEILDYDKAEDLLYLKKDNLFLTINANYPHIIKEIFCWHLYFINPKLLKHPEYMVVDIGMNRGYASLYFANQTWCKAVIGFELNKSIYQMAQINLELNKSLGSKIQTFNYGLGAQDDNITMYYLPDRDGICTTSKEFLSNFAPEEQERVMEVEGIIKKSSTALKEVVDANSENHVILKLDVEGSEYDIINDLAANYPAFFDQVDIIVGEAHLGLQPLLDALRPFGYKEIGKKKSHAKTEDFLFVKG